MEKQDLLNREIEQLLKEFDSNFSKENVILYDEIYQKIWKQEKPAVQKQAEAFETFLEQKKILMTENDLLAGQLQNYLMRYSQPLPMEGDPHGFDPSVIKTGAVNPPENAAETIRMAEKYETTQEERRILSYLPDGVAAGYFTHYPIGHAITGFPFVVHTGWKQIKEMIRDSLKRDSLTEQQRLTGQAMLRTVKACQSYFAQYQDKAQELYHTAVTERSRMRLRRIAEALEHIREYPAQNFFEAVQFVVLLQELILTQMKGSMSLGRLDVLFYDFLKEDLEKKRETLEDAQQLIDAFMLKIAGCRNAYQNVTLGGIDEEGDYAGNAVSMMILDSAKRLSFDQPLLSYRLNDQVLDEHWEKILDLIAKGGGFPALFWDDTIISSRTKMGVDWKDAVNYGIVGCVEPSIGGKEFSNTEALRINWCKTLELMLNGGKCPVTGKQFFLKEKKNLDAIATFEEFFDWYREELCYATQVAARICNLTDRNFAKEYPSTLLSISLEDCIERLDDCGNKGCQYCNSAINHTGVASAVDSLSAIRKMVFEEHILTLSEFTGILNHNFDGSEELLRKIKDEVPTYGNDIEEVDDLAVRLVNELAEFTQNLKNERGGSFLAGFYSVYHHAAMGCLTGALPSGRKKGESLSNGLSPVQGADKEGPSAVIASMRGMDQTQFANGMVLDLKLNPSFIKKQSHRLMLRRFLEVYFKQGGMEIQINVVDRKTLLDAQKHPENYQNLIVRVSGFSAYFVNLFEELQNEIIKRTEYDYNEHTTDVAG